MLDGRQRIERGRLRAVPSRSSGSTYEQRSCMGSSASQNKREGNTRCRAHHPFKNAGTAMTANYRSFFMLRPAPTGFTYCHNDSSPRSVLAIWPRGISEFGYIERAVVGLQLKYHQGHLSLQSRLHLAWR